MGKIFSVCNQKGGVGKTTTSVNLAASLAYLGKKVLLVDIDPQANSTQGVGIPLTSIEKTIYDVLINNDSINDAILPTRIPKLHIIPAAIDLAAAELELANLPSREKRLKNQLEKIRYNYDYFIIDCPPSLGLLNTNALTASNAVIIPVQCEYYALEGLTQLLSTIRLAQRVFNPTLYIEGVLLTMLDARTKLGIEVSQEVRKYFKEKVYKAYIPRNIRLSEAPSLGLSIFDYDPRSEGAKAYYELGKEVIERNEQQ